MIKGFIPATKKEFSDLKWKKADVIIVTGDAYIDHPFSQAASAGRFLNSNGCRTAILDMPDIENDGDWTIFGRPSLFFLVITGKEDSMAMNYTSYKKFRSTDPYVPGGKRLKRPDRAAIRYCGKIRELYKDSTIILAGAEAAGRMATHYDYWTDKLRKPILFDSKADIILYGQIEHSLLKICSHLRAGKSTAELAGMNGTSQIINSLKGIKNYKLLMPHSDIEHNSSLLAEHHLQIHQNQNPFSSSLIVQEVMGRYLFIGKPLMPMTEEETDAVYDTGFIRRPHPKYKEEIPIFRFIKDVVMTHAGSLNDMPDSQDVFVSGRFISSRSNESIRKEVVRFIRSKEYNKTVRIFGSPFFNHYSAYPAGTKKCSSCERLSCTLPEICPNIRTEERKILRIMEGFDVFPNVRNNYYASGPDLQLLLRSKELLKDYLTNRNNGSIDISIGSFSDEIRALSGLDSAASCLNCIRTIQKRSGEYGRKIEVCSAFQAGYPGQTEETVSADIDKASETDVRITGSLNFVPLPLTISSAQYFTGIDPVSRKEISIDKKLGSMKRHEDRLKRSRKAKKTKRA